MFEGNCFVSNCYYIPMKAFVFRTKQWQFVYKNSQCHLNWEKRQSKCQRVWEPSLTNKKSAVRLLDRYVASAWNPLCQTIQTCECTCVCLSLRVCTALCTWRKKVKWFNLMFVRYTTHIGTDTQTHICIYLLLIALYDVVCNSILITKCGARNCMAHA